jgi:hypothetical protein
MRFAAKRGFSIERLIKARSLMKTKKKIYHQSVGYNDLILKRVTLREYQMANADYLKAAGFYSLPFIVAIGLGTVGYWQIKRIGPAPFERHSLLVDLAFAGALGLSIGTFCKRAGFKIWTGQALAPFVIGLGLSGMGSAMFMKPEGKFYLIGSTVGFSLFQIV